MNEKMYKYKTIYMFTSNCYHVIRLRFDFMHIAIYLLFCIILSVFLMFHRRWLG